MFRLERARRRALPGARVCLAVVVIVARAAMAAPLDPGSTLCLEPLDTPLPKTEGEQRRLNVQQRLRDALIHAGFVVPDPQAVADISDRVQNSIGGFVDTAMGRRDELRYRAFVSRRAAELRKELGCDAVLSASVVQLRAPFSDGTATWDGTSESVSSTGRVVLNALGGVHEFGWVGALSLWLKASDLDGNDLAFRSAGIETLASMAVLQNQDILPQDVWLTNLEKLDAAIQSAVGADGEALRHRGVPSSSAAPTSPGTDDARRALGRPDSSDQR